MWSSAHRQGVEVRDAHKVSGALACVLSERLRARHCLEFRGGCSYEWRQSRCRASSCQYSRQESIRRVRHSSKHNRFCRRNRPGRDGAQSNKFIAQYRDVDKARAGRMLGLCSLVTISTGVVAALVLLLGSTHIAKNILDTPSLVESIALASGVVLFATINGFQVGALAGLERYRDFASVSWRLPSCTLRFAERWDCYMGWME